MWAIYSDLLLKPGTLCYAHERVRDILVLVTTQMSSQLIDFGLGWEFYINSSRNMVVAHLTKTDTNLVVIKSNLMNITLLNQTSSIT